MSTDALSDSLTKVPLPTESSSATTTLASAKVDAKGLETSPLTVTPQNSISFLSSDGDDLKKSLTSTSPGREAFPASELRSGISSNSAYDSYIHTENSQTKKLPIDESETNEIAKLEPIAEPDGQQPKSDVDVEKNEKESNGQQAQCSVELEESNENDTGHSNSVADRIKTDEQAIKDEGISAEEPIKNERKELQEEATNELKEMTDAEPILRESANFIEPKICETTINSPEDGDPSPKKQNDAPGDPSEKKQNDAPGKPITAPPEQARSDDPWSKEPLTDELLTTATTEIEAHVSGQIESIEDDQKSNKTELAVSNETKILEETSTSHEKPDSDQLSTVSIENERQPAKAKVLTREAIQNDELPTKHNEMATESYQKKSSCAGGEDKPVVRDIQETEATQTNSVLSSREEVTPHEQALEETEKKRDKKKQHKEAKKSRKTRQQVFESRPRESTADASALKPSTNNLAKQSVTVFESKPKERPEVYASALRPLEPKPQTRTLFESQARKSVADASSLSRAPSQSDRAGRTVYESKTRPFRADSGASQPLSPKSEQRVVFESKAKPVEVSARAADALGPASSHGVFQSQTAVSKAAAKASDPVPAPKDSRTIFANTPAPSLAHVRAVDPVQDASECRTKSNAEQNDLQSTDALKRQRSIFESKPVEHPDVSARWNSPVPTRTVGTIYENKPAPSTADAAASRELTDYSSSESDDDDSSDNYDDGEKNSSSAGTLSHAPLSATVSAEGQ